MLQRQWLGLCYKGNGWEEGREEGPGGGGNEWDVQQATVGYNYIEKELRNKYISGVHKIKNLLDPAPSPSPAAE